MADAATALRSFFQMVATMLFVSRRQTRKVDFTGRRLFNNSGPPDGVSISTMCATNIEEFARFAGICRERFFSSLDAKTFLRIWAVQRI